KIDASILRYAESGRGDVGRLGLSRYLLRAGPYNIIFAAAVPPAPTTSIRAEPGRALADGLARALAVGDSRTARIALAALSGLVDDAPEGGGAAVVDLGEERRRRDR